MDQTIYTGIIGLQANQEALNVTANNIAGVDTTGFKKNRAEFQNLFSKALAGANGPVNSTVGLGSEVATTPLIASAGSINNTGVNTDLAIDGNGWFGVEGNNQVAYTRDGKFTFDANGNFVNTQGDFVLGSTASGLSQNGTINPNTTVSLGSVTAQAPISLPTNISYPTTPTTVASFFGNLGTTNTTQVVSATAIDSKGDKNNLQLTFTKSAKQPASGLSWDVNATLKSATSNNILSTNSGVVTFNQTGGLISSTLGALDNNGTPLSINLGSNYSGIVSNSSKTGNLNSSVNGQLGGVLTGYSVNNNAQIVASFSNSKQVPVAQIALYHFQNQQALQSIGGSKYVESNDTGKPFFYTNSSGKSVLGAKVLTGSLESSNVNLSTSLTQLIVLQRSYDANSKSITVGNQLLQKALQM